MIMKGKNNQSCRVSSLAGQFVFYCLHTTTIKINMAANDCPQHSKAVGDSPKVHVAVQFVPQWSHSCNNTTQHNINTQDRFRGRSEGVTVKTCCWDSLPLLVDRRHRMERQEAPCSFNVAANWHNMAKNTFTCR